MSKKLDRALHGPGWVEVILGAFLSLVLGVVLGALLLVLRPVVVAKETPKEPVPGAVYYIEGSRDGSKSRQALAKRKAFVEGQSITVTEEELNSITAPPPATTAAKPAEKAGDAPAPADGTVSLAQPNFRLAEGKLQVGVPVTINVFDLAQKVIVQARGGFVKKGEMFVYEPEKIYVGSCPVERLPFVSSYLREKIVEAQALPEDIKASWVKLANVSVEGRTLKLTMP